MLFRADLLFCEGQCDARCTFILRGWSCASQHCSQAQEWDDEMIKVPNGVVCAAVNGEVFFKSGQSIRFWKSEEDSQKHPNEKGVQQTVVMCDAEVSQRSWILFTKSSMTSS